MRLTLAAISLLLTLAAGCDNAPGKDKPKATVSSAVPAASQPAPADAVSWPITQEQSKVEFVGAKVTGKHNGGFGRFSGTVQLAGMQVESARIQIDIDMTSVTSDADKLTGHLKSADFFDVDKHPKATFSSTSIKASGGGGSLYTVAGNLTLRGVTKSVTFPATIKATADSIDAASEFAINRKDWGIVFPGQPDNLIKDEVLIKLLIRSSKPKS